MEQICLVFDLFFVFLLLLDFLNELIDSLI